MPPPSDAESPTESTPNVATLVASLAHALRNPLAAAFANLEVLERQVSEREAERARCGRIAADLDRIRIAIEDLTEYAAPSSVHGKPMGLDAWLRGTSPLLQLFAEARGATVKITNNDLDGRASTGADCLVLADPNVLRKSIFRLMQNAIDAGALRIQITVKLTEAFAELRVQSDTPSQGPAGELDIKAFETAKPRNLGLGLTLARAALAKIGARLRIERTERGATQAILTLGRADTDAKEAFE